MAGYRVLSLGICFGVKDSELDGWLERIIAMTGKRILMLASADSYYISVCTD
jgi:hypothetical protein